MIKLKDILKNPEYIKTRLVWRDQSNARLVDKIVALGKKRNVFIMELEQLKSQKNQISKQISKSKDNLKSQKTSLLTQVKQIKQKIIQKEIHAKNVFQTLKKLLLEIPNLPEKKILKNLIYQDFSSLGNGLITKLKSHEQLGLELDLIEIKRAVKISGTRFVAYKNFGAKLFWALQKFMLDSHLKNGYQEWIPPLIVTSKTMIGTGQLPKFVNESFKLDKYDKWLIPTAEVSLTNLFADEIIDLDTTKSLVAYTPCFRSEAGAGGKETRGIIRLHQFHKVELVKLTTHEFQDKEFINLVNDATKILKLLKLPFRIVELSNKELGFAAKKTFDLEVWMPSEQKFKEISSISNFGEFQSRRSMIRYKKANKNEYAITLNASGLAIDRCLAAILENYQNADGSIMIPKILVKYLGCKTIVK